MNSDRRDAAGRDHAHADSGASGYAGDEAVLDTFLEVVTRAGLTLYPAQEEAVLALFEGANVILNTPTGSGKSLVARALHFRSVAGAGRSVYTSPVKALVNEKWSELCAQFGPEPPRDLRTSSSMSFITTPIPNAELPGRCRC